MKKLITIIALVLTVALCSSFAIGATTATPNTPASADVVFNYTAATTDTTTVVYSVDVQWTDVTFAYTAVSNQWNPAEHDYTTSVNKGWTDKAGSVKVTNHSNAAVAVAVAFNEAQNSQVNVAVANGSFTLVSAVNSAYDEAPNATAALTASGTPTASGDVGTITVTVSAVASN